MLATRDAIQNARRFLLSRLFTSLAAALGVMQVLVAHWAAVMVGAASARS